MEFNVLAASGEPLPYGYRAWDRGSGFQPYKEREFRQPGVVTIADVRDPSQRYKNRLATTFDGVAVTQVPSQRHECRSYNHQQ